MLFFLRLPILDYDMMYITNCAAALLLGHCMYLCTLHSILDISAVQYIFDTYVTNIFQHQEGHSSESIQVYCSTLISSPFQFT